jgi:hypothetical protein
MRYRVAAAFACLAFVVALAAGLAGGVRFGTVLLRAVAGAAVFAVLGTAIMAVLRRFLPELVSRPADAAGPAETASEPEGETPRIDIVLPEENPLEDAIAADLEPADEAPAEPLEEPEPDLSRPLEGAAEPVGRPSAVEDLTAEPPGQSGGGDTDSGDSDDALPSLDGLDLEPPEPPSEASRGASGAAGASGARVDPSQAARALKTWLKRDHEG